MWVAMTNILGLFEKENMYQNFMTIDCGSELRQYTFHKTKKGAIESLTDNEVEKELLEDICIIRNGKKFRAIAIFRMKKPQSGIFRGDKKTRKEIKDIFDKFKKGNPDGSPMRINIKKI